MIKRFIALGIALLTMATFSFNAFAASKAFPWKQSKQHWCWATVAKAMINTCSGISIPSDYVQVNDQFHIRTDCCLYQNNKYITDKAQEYIVRTYKNDPNSFVGKNRDDLGGSTSEIIDAVSSMTGEDLETYGNWGETPFSDSATRTSYIDNHLVTDSKEICGNLYSHPPKKEEAVGHSLLITEKTSSGSYKTWNPWTNTYTTYTPAQLFTNGFKAAPYTSKTMYIDNVVYFTS